MMPSIPAGSTFGSSFLASGGFYCLTSSGWTYDTVEFNKGGFQGFSQINFSAFSSSLLFLDLASLDSFYPNWQLFSLDFSSAYRIGLVCKYLLLEMEVPLFGSQWNGSSSGSSGFLEDIEDWSKDYSRFDALKIDLWRYMKVRLPLVQNSILLFRSFKRLFSSPRFLKHFLSFAGKSLYSYVTSIFSYVILRDYLQLSYLTLTSFPPVAVFKVKNLGFSPSFEGSILFTHSCLPSPEPTGISRGSSMLIYSKLHDRIIFFWILASFSIASPMVGLLLLSKESIFLMSFLREVELMASISVFSGKFFLLAGGASPPISSLILWFRTTSRRTIPKDQMSVQKPCCSPSNTSGELYQRVPTFLVSSSDQSPRYLEMPKSPIFALPLERRMFSGLMSRWMTLLLWRQLSPAEMSMSHESRSTKSNQLLPMTLSRLPPEQNSKTRTKYLVPFSIWWKWFFRCTIFSCFSFQCISTSLASRLASADLIHLTMYLWLSLRELAEQTLSAFREYIKLNYEYCCIWANTYFNNIINYWPLAFTYMGVPPCLIWPFLHHIKLICNIQMGHCHCCPFLSKRKKSEDTLSIDTYHPSIAIEMPNRNIKRALKKSQKRMNGTIKKQPIQIKQKHPRIPTLIDQTDPKIVPLLTPKNIGHLPLENDSSHLDRLKRIKPQIQKISTMDDDEGNSRSHSFHNQQSEQESFNEGEPKVKKNTNNLTFTANQQHIVVIRQFRTNKDKAHLEQQARESQLARLHEDLKKQNLPIDTKCEIYYKLAKHQCELSHFDNCNKYLSTAILKLKEIQSEELKFAIISLHGYVLLIEKEYAKSIPFLLKAVRMEVTRQGGETIKLVELYYWIGEAYLNQGNTKFSKEYLSKALRFYSQFQMQDSQLLKALYLNLGILLHKQGELAEADKFYTKAIKISEETTIGTKYFQLLLKKAENYFSMQNYKLSLWGYASTFKALRKYNLTQLQIHEQAKASFVQVLKKIESICISQSELQGVIKSADECIHDLPQVKILKARLKKMRQILYK